MRSPRPAISDAPLTKLKGAGPKLSEAAAEIGVSTLGDLLRHLPHSYRDRASPIGLADLKLGEEATVEVEVTKAGKVRPTRRRRLTILEAEVGDESGRITATWFNRAWLADKLTPGTRLLLLGKLEKRGFNVAQHELLGEAEGSTPAGIHTTGLVPVHPASERLRPQKLREWAWQAAPLAANALEPLPARQRAQDGMPGSPTRWSRRISRPTRARRPRRAGGLPSRSCCSTRHRWPPGAGAGPRAAADGDRTRWASASALARLAPSGGSC